MNLATGLVLSSLPRALAPGLTGAMQLTQFNMEGQKGDFWCWVAVAASIHSYYRSLAVNPAAVQTFEQCGLAQSTLMANGVQVATCCPVEDHPECNKAFATDLALKQAQNLDSVVDDPIPFDEIKSQIQDEGANGHPIGCSMMFLKEAGAHAVVIYGWTETDDGGQCVYVANPDGPTTSYDEYSRFKLGKKRRWRRTYLTKG